MRHRVLVAALATLTALLLAGSATAAKRRTNWVHPKFTSFGVHRIALVPVVSYDHDADAEASIGAGVLNALSSKGYEWVPPESVVVTLAAESDGGALSPRAVRDYVLHAKDAHIDPLVAPALCAQLGVDAVMSARVDNESSGTPWLKGALVARDGTLLWTGNRTTESFVGRTRDKPARRAAEHAAATSWVVGIGPILERWADEFPNAAP